MDEMTEHSYTPTPQPKQEANIHTLKKYMNTGTHSEEVHEHRHTL